MKLFYYLLIILLLPVCCFGQFSISGRVLNQADTKPVADASVFLSNATIGTKTNPDGTFTLRNTPPGKYVMVISIVGFETYSQSVLVTGRDVILNDITIFPKTIALNQVTIRPVEDPNRPAYMARFKKEFLGASENAQNCKILNPEMIDFDHNDSAEVLKASSESFILIENDALGYKLKYLLANFEETDPDLVQQKVSYKGFVLFEEMKGSPAEEKRWQQARLQVYENSSMHFLRALLTGQAREEGFRVQQIAILANPERPPDSVIKAKIKLYTALKSKANRFVDSLFFWDEKLRLEKTFITLYPFPLASNEIVKKTVQAGIYALGCDGDDLYITYNKHGHFERRGDLSRVYSRFNTNDTWISFSSIYALFDDNGWISDPESISISGAWANERMADLLPEDYRDTVPVQ